ncbi:glucosyltransferase domain-containing protein [Pantoea sp. PSNIH1]|uniref:glucosyltransferase domain-containing protein n=1 Tax=Pantoea sp. PSNIH1 TaxID=1484158 RepID=UPI0011A2E085|nr:glucosyltransferase domain-containing protein [Pantoea sp. PSNIH1]
MMNEIKNDRWPIVIALAIAMAFVMPFSIHNIDFVDDWIRVDTGNTGWEGNGRPVSSIVMALLSLSLSNFFGDGVLKDTFPFNLYLSSILMVSSGYIICKMLKIRSKGIMTLMMICPVVNPYWIGNISFRFDSLVMSMAFIFAVMSVILVNYNTKRNFFLAVTSAIIMLCLYQAAINVIIALATVISLSKVLQNGTFRLKDTIIFPSMAVVVISYAIYSILIYKYLEISDYTKLSGEVVGLGANVFKSIFSNIYELSKAIFTITGSLIALSVYAIIFSSIYCSFRLPTENFSVKAAFFIGIVLVFLFSFGFLSFLKHPTLSSRVFLSFCFVPLLLLFISDRCNCKSYLIVIPFLVASFSLSSIVSNAMGDVQRYDRFVAERIANKLYDYGYKSGDNLFISGKPGTPLMVSRKFDSLPIVSEMSVSAYANTRFKYSLMRQYNINSPTPNLDIAIRETNNCSADNFVFHDNLISICKSYKGFSVLIGEI